MSFLHPWAIYAGVVAAGLPVAIHFLTRPRPVRQPLSTLRFVRELLRQRNARSRLRDALVLLCRVAMILAVAAAIARPQWGAAKAANDASTGDTLRVVVLDVSQSMGANDGPLQLLERARAKAAEYLRYQPGLHANLVLAAAAPRSAFEQPSTNFESLAEELRAAHVTSEGLDVARTLEAAAKMLNPQTDQPQLRRELVIVSDFQRGNWATADFTVVPADAQIELVSVDASKPLANLAIVRAECRGRAVVGRTTQLEVSVANYTPAARDVVVEATLGESAYRLRGKCPPQRTTTLVEEIPLRQAGWQWGAARLVDHDDALPADDWRPLILEVRPQPLYALVTRQTESQRPASSHFLECALVPDATAKERASARLARVSPQALDRETLAPADLIALDHPGKLEDTSLKLLASLLRRGKPMLYVTAEPVDAVNLKRLADDVGRAWQLPVEFSSSPAGQSRRGAFLTSYRRETPALRVFGEQLDTALGGLRFSGGLISRRLDAGVADDVLASFNDGSAAIVLSASDAGSLLILNADLAASNLSASGAFVPLVDELVQQALDRRRPTTVALCGQRSVAHLPGEVGTAAGLKVVGPEGATGASGESEFGQLSDDGAGVQWLWAAPGAPGVYRVVRDQATVFALAVAIPEEESQLTALPRATLVERMAGGRAIHFQSTLDQEPDQDRLWKWLCVGCIGCALGEIGLHLLFRA